MKKILLLIQFLIITFLSIAQSPNGFNYQAVVRDSNGNPKAGQSVVVVLSINQGSASGNSVYSEQHNVQTDQYGLISLKIGQGTSNDSFSAIDWSAGSYFISTQIDGNNYGTSQLMSVPYAMYSNNSGSSTPGPQGPRRGLPWRLAGGIPHRRGRAKPLDGFDTQTTEGFDGERD